MASILDEFLILFRPTVKGNGLTRLNKGLQQTRNNLFSMKNLFSAFIGYDVYSGIKALGGSMIDASREMGAMRSRFFAITKDEEKANQQLQWAFNLAERTAMPMKSLADSYSIFYAAVQKGLGDTGAQQVFQEWTEVSRVLHMSEYQFERVTYALREMASKGVVYSQDLRMQIGTHVPNAIGLAEKAVNDLGITGTDWFEKFQEQSKGNQKMINQFLLLFSKHAKEMYADPEALKKAMQQPDAQLLRLRNQWDKIRYAMVESGFQDDLLNALLQINNLLDKITGHAKQLYEIIKDIIKIAGVILGVKFATQIIGMLSKVGMFFGRFGKLFAKRGMAKGFSVIMRFLGRKAIGMGLKGLLFALPTGITQVIGALWLVWDVLSLIWDLLKLKFPNQMTALKFNILAFLNNLVAENKQFFDDIKTILKALGVIIKYVIIWPLKLIARLIVTIAPMVGGLLVGAFKILGTVIDWVVVKPLKLVVHLIALSIRGIGKIKQLWDNRKIKGNVFPEVTPDTNSWDYVYQQSLVTPMANRLSSNQMGGGNTIAVNNQINIDASGLTEEQAANMIADAQEQNNQNIFRQFGNDIRNSKLG